jgi:putative endonuclease
MEFLRKKIAAAADAGAPAAGAVRTTKQAGDAAEALALRHLQAAGLRLVCRNYRTPGRGGGEIDLVMRERVAGEDTLVFVEVRRRRDARHGGAAASVGAVKQRRIVFAARHYLMRLPGAVPPCRFDVVTVEGGDGDRRVGWLRAAFDAG